MKLIGTLVAMLLTACLPQTQTAYTATPTYAAPSYGTGVYINGQELSAQDKAQLDNLVGDTVPPGRYFVDANGNAGPEGGPPVVNLYALAQQRGGVSAQASETTQIFGTGPTGPSSMTAVGDCIMVSTPDASFDTGC